MALMRKIAWYVLTGTGIAFGGALLGTCLMMMGFVISGNAMEGALTFGVLGLSWSRQPARIWKMGAALGGASGFFAGLLRIRADPILYPMVEALWGYIVFISGLLAWIALFWLGVRSVERRRWLAGIAVLVGWKFGGALAAPLLVATRDGMDLTQIVADAFGVGCCGGAAGLLLACALGFLCGAEPAGAQAVLPGAEADSPDA